MVYKQLMLWESGQATQATRANFVQDGERQLIHYRESESKSDD